MPVIKVTEDYLKKIKDAAEEVVQKQAVSLEFHPIIVENKDRPWRMRRSWLAGKSV